MNFITHKIPALDSRRKNSTKNFQTINATINLIFPAQPYPFRARRTYIIDNVITPRVPTRRQHLLLDLQYHLPKIIKVSEVVVEIERGECIHIRRRINRRRRRRRRNNIFEVDVAAVVVIRFVC